MSAAWVRVEETVGREDDGRGGVTYTCRFVVAQAYGVPRELFVHRTDDGSYSHVATVDDLAAWPNTREEARDLGRTFFRAMGATSHALARTALATLIEHTKRRLAEVAAAWDPEVASLTVPGERTYVLGGAS